MRYGALLIREDESAVAGRRNGRGRGSPGWLRSAVGWRSVVH